MIWTKYDKVGWKQMHPGGLNKGFGQKSLVNYELTNLKKATVYNSNFASLRIESNN